MVHDLFIMSALFVLLLIHIVINFVYHIKFDKPLLTEQKAVMRNILFHVLNYIRIY